MSYNSLPLDSLFPEQSVVLSGTRKQDPVTREWEFTECIFYLRFDFDDACISISVFDDVTRSYIYGTEYVTSLERAVSLLQEIDAAYPGHINVKKLTAKCKLFLRVAENAVSIKTPVSDYSDSCDQCGDYNVDILRFLYVPAVEGAKLREGSLDIHWDYGCYGGSMIQGSYEDYREQAEELLGRALSMASSKKYKKEIRRALNSLEPAEI